MEQLVLLLQLSRYEASHLLLSGQAKSVSTVASILGITEHPAEEEGHPCHKNTLNHFEKRSLTEESLHSDWKALRGSLCGKCN